MHTSKQLTLGRFVKRKTIKAFPFSRPIFPSSYSYSFQGVFFSMWKVSLKIYFREVLNVQLTCRHNKAGGKDPPGKHYGTCTEHMGNFSENVLLGFFPLSKEAAQEAEESFKQEWQPHTWNKAKIQSKHRLNYFSKHQIESYISQACHRVSNLVKLVIDGWSVLVPLYKGPYLSPVVVASMTDVT